MQHRRLAALAALATIIPASSFAQETAPDTILVTEAFHSLLYLPVYVARHQGIFENHSIDVPVVRSAGTGPTALAAVLSGEAQFSVHGPEHVGFAAERGGHAKAVSAVANSAPVWALARPDAGISETADFAGKTVSVGLAPGTSNTLIKRYIEEGGLEGEVTLNEVQNGSELGPVLAGQADIAVAYQPQVEQGISQGLEIVHAFTDDFPQYAFSTINTSMDLIESNPDLVERFVAAIEESLQLIHSDPEIAKEVARLEFAQLDAAIVDAAVDRMIAANVYPQSVEITEEALGNAVAVQQYVGNIQGEMPYDTVVDPTFTQSVLAEAGQ